MGHVSGSIGGMSAKALDGSLAARGFAAPTIRHLSAGNLTRWTAARGRALAMGGLARVNLIGDSTQGLVGTGTGSSLAEGGQPRSLAAQLVKMLNARAGRADFARSDGYWGNHFSTANNQNTWLAYDPRWSMSGTLNSDTVNLAGGSITSPTGQTGTLTLSGIAAAYDRVRLVGRRTTSGGTVAVASASGGGGSFALAGGTAVIETTLSTTKGNGNLSLAFDSGYCNIIAVELWDSAAGQVIVRDLAYSGSHTGATTAGWTAGNPLNLLLPMMQAEFALYCFGLNDASYGTAPADVAANLAAIIAANGGAGSIALTAENESSAGWNATGTVEAQRAIAAQVRALGLAQGYPVIDMPARWGDYAAANANALMANDPHPNAAGYADKAVAAMQLLWA